MDKLVSRECQKKNKLLTRFTYEMYLIRKLKIQIMKNFKLSYFSLIIISCLFICSCAKDIVEVTGPNTQFPESGEVIVTNVHGVVLDDQGPLQNAEVHLKSATMALTTQTDEYGNFLFSDVSHFGNSAYLTVVKEGKFDAFRRMSVFKDRYSYTQIKMVDKTILSAVTNSAGAALDHPSGAKITLPANSVVDGNGQVVAGEYNVSMTWIDPSAADLAQRMVGDLSGVNTEGNVSALTSFGMLQVELNDAGGDELNLKDGSFANLRFPVPSSMINNAPSTIPLWSFDEEHGYWVEEGEATLVDNIYVADVGHFSTWNVDTKDDPVDISGQFVIDNYGRPLPPSYFQVSLCLSSGASVGGWLCDDGSFEFLNAPQGESFTLKLMDYCGETIYSEEIGPFDMETIDLGDIEVMSSTVLDLQAITGNAINCDSEAVTDGFIQVIYNDFLQIHPLNEDGTFDFLVTTCEEFEVLFQVLDNSTIMGSDWISVSNIDGVFEFNDLFVCSDLENYLHFVIEGHIDVLRTGDLSLQSFWSENNPLDTAIVFNSIIQEPNFLEIIRITWPSSAQEGTPTPGITVDPSNTVFMYSGIDGDFLVPAEDVETLLEISPGSDFSNEAKGSFNGTIIIDGNDVPIYGSFHINN